jgi:hypothetical protein
MTRIFIDLPARVVKRLDQIAGDANTSIHDLIVSAATTTAGSVEQRPRGVRAATRTAACGICGCELSGRQQKWCTDACRQKAYRQRALT